MENIKILIDNKGKLKVDANGENMTEYSGVVLSKLFGRKFSSKQIEDDLTNKLKSHDWTYQMGSGGAYKSGKRSEEIIDVLRVLMNYLGLQKEYTELYNKHKKVVRL